VVRFSPVLGQDRAGGDAEAPVVHGQPQLRQLPCHGPIRVQRREPTLDRLGNLHHARSLRADVIKVHAEKEVWGVRSVDGVEDPRLARGVAPLLDDAGEDDGGLDQHRLCRRGDGEVRAGAGVGQPWVNLDGVAHPAQHLVQIELPPR
jgi:hypothetical protein